MLDLSQTQHAHIDQRLRSDVIVWLNTVRADGRPHSVAVWFLWDGEQFLIFSRPKNQKVRNVRQNPHVVLALDNTDNGSDVIVVEGTAELITDPNVNTTVAAYSQKYASELKSMSMTAEAMSKDYSQGIRITPTKFVRV
ncbi:MAG: TIGR03667 family PPOX class F420-dependent oxidoreductase [Ktedonobacteraceae bacterium]